MKDSKFVELLNLYLDQQIEPAEAVLLEEEIVRNPARRRIYGQYCRMHRACSLLQEQSRPQAGVGEKFAAATTTADEKLARYPNPAPIYTKGIYFGGLAAAAACLVLLFVAQPWKHKPAAPAAGPNGDQMVQIAPVPAHPAPVAARERDYQPVLVAHSLRLSDVPADFRLADSASLRPSLGWMTQVQLAPLPLVLSAKDLDFETPATLRNDQNLFRSRLPVQGAKEKAAYQFQR
ncbi:MAG: hypothetical protein EXS39_05955 [Opitutaceae bacterium]|nr:hypothetical protein [Opitutaceae bacterium]